MSITIAVVAQGMMGSGVGKRLHESGAEVRTLLSGRSAASADRARAAGMKPAADETELLDGARFGCAEALVAELSSSQPQIFGYLKNSVPRMYDKAYRWVAEMEEISDFLGANPPSRDIYAAIARLYDYLAAAEAEEQPGP